MTPFAVSILTLFPEAFPGTLGVSLIGRARTQGLWTLDTVQIRAFATDKHATVDDTPAGGGPGMVMRPDVLAAAIDSVPQAGRPRLLLSPRGAPLTQAHACAWAEGPGLILVCGRFEGVDERVIEGRGLEEVCVGDAVLAGGEAAALVLAEAVLRLRPGVLGNAQSLAEESFEDGLLEQPAYTRPRVWEGREIPEALLSGDHARIRAWRQAMRERLTEARRPDLFARWRAQKDR